MIRKNEIVLYIAHANVTKPILLCVLNIGLFRFSLSLDPCFLPFYTTIALQILYTTNFLIENVFYLLVYKHLAVNSK